MPGQTPACAPVPQATPPAQAPHSSEPPLQPLPILPQYWPPAGAQITDGVQTASLLPASVVITTVPPVPLGVVAPLVPPVPAPVVPAVPVPLVAPAVPPP